jgi:pyrroline-5-carboxylate reductase
MEAIGILGFGVMGQAFAAGLRRGHPDRGILVYDTDPVKLAAAGSSRGIAAAKSLEELVRGSDPVIICVKPQDLTALLPAIRGSSKGKGVISILAGRRIETLAAGLRTEQIARLMPNLAAIKGKAVVGVAFHAGARDGFRKECLGLVGALGVPQEIPERLMAAMTGVSGSGIAYALCFLHAMAQGGVAAGFDYAAALKVAAATVEGAVSLLEDGSHPMALVGRVTSPAGTTIQGVRALEKGGFSASVMEAVEAASRRASELEG